MSAQMEIQLIAVVVAVACSLPGVFLVLRKMAMMTDAITHTILLGIVAAFFVVHDLNSPLLIIGAAAVGLLTVYLVELITATRLVSEDAAIGIVFPLLFSIAIIWISRYAGKVHIDTDAVLLGELAFAPFNRLVIGGVDLGPKALYTMGTVLVLNVVMIVLLFKELKISIFDAGLASVLGFSPVLIQYLLMTSVSVTTVAAFEAVGSILVIAFMVGPPITAYLLTDHLKRLLCFSAAIGTFNALVGYRFAYAFDVSIAGSMATVTGLTFLLAFIAAPKRGMITVLRRRSVQRREFAQKAIVFHMHRHTDTAEAREENGVKSLHLHVNYSRERLEKTMRQLIREEKVVVLDGIYHLTEKGRHFALESYDAILGTV
ncbi:metal ABC transporter permease [Fusibacter sp. JL298sf-3]